MSLPGVEGSGDGAVWTYKATEERLIEAAGLWGRSPGEGVSPYAKDAPWHMMRRINEAGDAFNFYDPRGFDVASSEVPLRPLPLQRAEVGRRDEASAWVERYVGESDRRLVWRVLFIKARGRRPDWIKLLRELGLSRGAEGLRKRYTRGVGAIAAGLDRDRVAVVEART